MQVGGHSADDRGEGGEALLVVGFGYFSYCCRGDAGPGDARFCGVSAKDIVDLGGHGIASVFGGGSGGFGDGVKGGESDLAIQDKVPKYFGFCGGRWGQTDVQEVVAAKVRAESKNEIREVGAVQDDVPILIAGIAGGGGKWKTHNLRSPLG